MNGEQVVAFAERLAQIAGAGGGPDALAAQLAEATGTSVLLEDTQRRRIAGAGTIPALGDGAEGRAALLSLRIESNGTHLGWLSVFGEARKAGAARDLELLLRLVAAAAATELARRPDAAQGRRSAFWERLLERRHHDADAARDDARASGISPAVAYLTIALEREAGADADGSHDLAELRAIVADVFRGGDADTGLLERGATLLAFVPAVREVDASNARTAAALLPKTIAKRAYALLVSGGVGTVEPPLTLHRSADTAQAALAIGRRVLGDGRVVSYDELGAYPLLYEGADLRRLQSFAHSVLAPLRAYDEKHQTELERTLCLFFETGQNIKTAAARLNVHRHTVFYRLRQIGDICACSLESPHDQLTLRLAVAIDALHSS